jgi:phosphoenolpyruvate synthase/pyruvate phosphate dikinase
MSRFSELLHIDAPLAIAEITNEVESATHVPWATEAFPYHPYCVFERKAGALYYLYDQDGIDWKIRQAGLFDEGVLTEKSLERYQKIERTLTSEKPLEKDGFIELIALVKDAWIWLDGMWWMIEYRDKNGLDTTGLMRLRKQTEYFVPGLIATIRNTFRYLTPHVKGYVDVLRIDEVLSGNIPTEEVLQARMKTFAFTDGKLFTSLDEVKASYDVELKEEHVVTGSALKGQVAYPGKRTGMVKIINNRDDMKKFQAGDIIVSPTTTPDLLPVMKIAGAIISEHGGVICHASITSRELKIPCIVGVKGATKALKDGDIIEVDAENGIIRIMK